MTEQQMSNLTPAQRQEITELVKNARNCAFKNDFEGAVGYYKRAAGYGDTESMYALGECYAKAGKNQNLSVATEYFDEAAKNGNDAMKLKVARAFDVPMQLGCQALNLDKAKFWYNELTYSDDEKFMLEGAKGLDEMVEPYGKIKREALDMNRAYMTYRILAMRENMTACARAAYCNEVGKGTNVDIDRAIIFYRMARMMGNVDWCERKKSGKLEDSVFNACIEYDMPVREADPNSHGKEYYRGDVDFDAAEYDEMMYFVRYEYNTGASLFTSDDMGNGIRALCELPEEYNYAKVHANSTGIYLYTTRDHDVMYVLHLDFDGNKISECREEYEGTYEDGYSVSKVYIYGNDLFYVYEHGYDEEKECCIKCMHVDSDRIEKIYELASTVYSLYATDGYIIFKARYENEKVERGWVEGWMMMELATRETECLSNPYCSLENMVYSPEMYDELRFEYDYNCDFDRRIVFFDLSRKIFWTERVTLDGKDSAHLGDVCYWEPRALFGNRDEKIANMPVWKVVKGSRPSSREYFDGTVHYYDEGYFVFKSSDKYGEVYEWSEGNGGHGECDKFWVAGDYLYLNIAARGVEQYPLSVGKTYPNRKGWFGNNM